MRLSPWMAKGFCKENYTGKTEVKGRGNSTWGYPKKPYRLKLDKKSEICGLGKSEELYIAG